MMDEMTDSEFRRHVKVVCHLLAMRKHMRERPAASRAKAWEAATANWTSFIDPALDFLALQAVWQEQRAALRERLN